MFLFGLNRLFRGLRQANPALTLFGIVVAIVGWARSREKGRTLLYSKELEAGREIRLRVAGD